ncbi:unnamed protein product [Mytilus edulis]|uniref:AAA domain-containing protein n=1 Tax=Mytilus edulis TaxID=6550 RepID=A0A8S3UD49_MYTED|nr:unnamed protein product [Mytilus edulis]
MTALFSLQCGTIKVEQGKTSLVFQLSAEYARQNPTQKVIVIDMCPQANVSSSLLVNTFSNFPGEKIVSDASKIDTKKKMKSFEPNVCGYLLSRLDRDESLKGTINWNQFLIQASVFNKFVPDNLRLLCGDIYLEVLSKRLEQERQLVPTRYDNPWRRVTLFMKDFIEFISSSNKQVFHMFFIDTNPSFSIYTEMAITGARRMVVPFTQDDFSVSAIKSMLYSVYGFTSEDSERLEGLKESQYFWLAEKYGISPPKLHLFINNRATFYGTKAAAAFAAIGNEVSASLLKVYIKSQDIFETASELSSLDLIMDINKFKMRYLIDCCDFQSTIVLSLHNGCPFSQIDPGSHTIYGSSITISKTNLEDCKYAILKIVKLL